MLALLHLAHAAAFTLGITGDVNLNPSLKGSTTAPEYVWGDLIKYTRAVSLMAIQHEGTLAGISDPNPQTIQFEDPELHCDVCRCWHRLHCRCQQSPI